MMRAKPAGQDEELGVEGALPSLSGAVEWLNSKPLSAEELKGKVVLVDFWTYSCINCLRAIPYVRAWAEKYRDHGLVVIGVHAPEFAFERNVDNVRKAIATLRVGYTVAIDNDYKIWRAFENEYWPAHCFIDERKGRRHRLSFPRARPASGSGACRGRKSCSLCRYHRWQSPGRCPRRRCRPRGAGYRDLYQLVRNPGVVADHTFKIRSSIPECRHTRLRSVEITETSFHRIATDMNCRYI
jgi:thiol-disulfide isomerase/thioredoxin